MEAGYPLPLAERIASSQADLHRAVDLVGAAAAPPSSPPRSCSSAPTAARTPRAGVQPTSRPVKVEAILHGDRKVYSVSAFNRGIGSWLARLPDALGRGRGHRAAPPGRLAERLLHAEGPRGRLLPAVPDAARRPSTPSSSTSPTATRVHVYGRPELYEARGVFQLRALSLEPLGLGAALARIERLKRTLAAEGLFARRAQAAAPAPPAADRPADRQRGGREARLPHGRRRALPGRPGRRRRDARPGRPGAAPRSPPRSPRSPPSPRSTSSWSRAAAAASRTSSPSATSASCARSPPARCRSSPPSGTSRTRRSATSPPTPAPRRRPRPRGSSSRTSASCAAGLDRLRTALARRHAPASSSGAGTRSRHDADAPPPRARAPARAQARDARRAGRTAPHALAAGNARAGLRHRPGGRRHPPRRGSARARARTSTSSSPRAASAPGSRRRVRERRAGATFEQARARARAHRRRARERPRRPGGGGAPLGAGRGALPVCVGKLDAAEGAVEELGRRAEAVKPDA